jgi:hypothetical protein
MCIDAQLGGEARDDVDEGGEGSWEDEAVDGDWVKASIKIKVPFHKRTLRPGQEEFEAGVFYHRTLVSVIRERFQGHPAFLIFTSSRLSFTANQMKLRSQSGFMVNCTRPPHSLMPITIFKTHQKSRDVTFQGS